MLLDYSLPPFQFFIGAFDATDYLDEFAIALPIHEIGKPLLWSGRFKISFNKTAHARGLADTDFDQGAMPNRWRPGQVPVAMIINGYTLPVMRIERYAYNPQTRTGEGSLAQILQLLATDRPERGIGNTGGVISGVAPLSAVHYSISYAVDRLINLAFDGCTVQSPRQLGSQRGEIWGKVVSRDPISDAQKLLGTQWQWLLVDNTETIRSISGDPATQSILFSRTLGELEWEPDIDHINFDADRVIVTGSHQQPAKIPCKQDPQPVDSTLDRKGRIKFQKTTEYQPFSKVFAKGSGGDLSPTVSAQKWIFYNYVDDQSWDDQLWQFIPTDLNFDIQNDRPTVEAPKEGVAQTITVELWPAGRIFSKLGTNTSLSVAVLELQSEKRKARYVPAGTLNSKLGQDFTLKLERKEDLTTKPYFPGASNHAGEIDPKTGQAKCLEPVPQPEKRQELAEVPLETIAIKGEAKVAPINWVPIIPRDHVVEVGFLPDKVAANYLAQQIAKREAWRRDSVKVTMPIPIEWLAAGCPPLQRCVLHDGTWQMDGLIISFADQEAKFGFLAARIDRLGVSTLSTISDYDFEISLGTVVEAELGAIDIRESATSLRVSMEVSIGAAVLTDGVYDFGIRIGGNAGLFSALPSAVIDMGISIGGDTNIQAATASVIDMGISISGDTNIQAATANSLVYASDGDTNGLFYYVGTAGLSTTFNNPVPSQIPVLTSSTDSGNGISQPETILSGRGSQQWNSLNIASSWIAWDLGANDLAVTAYSLQSSYFSTTQIPRNWELQGCNSIPAFDNAGIAAASWTTINSQTNNASLVAASQWLTITVSGAAQYRYLRLIQTGLNSSGANFFVLGQVEFYGNL